MRIRMEFTDMETRLEFFRLLLLADQSFEIECAPAYTLFNFGFKLPSGYRETAKIFIEICETLNIDVSDQIQIENGFYHIKDCFVGGYYLVGVDTK